MSRIRLASVLISPALLVVLAAVVVSIISLSGLPSRSDVPTEAGLARVGDDLALVIVTGATDSLAETRSVIADWGLAAPALALAGAALVAWAVAGRVQHALGDARDLVERAADERERRLQEVVHELRTPLAVMGTNLELATFEAGGDLAGERYIGAARRAVGRMSRTVDDLAGHGQLAIEQQGAPFDLMSIAEEAVAEHVGPGRTRGVRVIRTGSHRVLVPSADPAAVTTAISNLLSNAVRLAPRGSTVGVDWGEHEDWAWIAVTDEGPGLAPHSHSRVFERGWQGPHDRDRAGRDGGSGLGLTIARQLTEAQGGVVTLESEEGGGSTFALWLPLEMTADSRSAVAGDRVHPSTRPWAKAPVTA